MLLYLLSNYIKSQTTITIASYKVTLMMIKKNASFRDSELIKQSVIKLALMLGENKVSRKF